jgi:NAD(P)-dependent dehydrogenase (short-subunit alcohol dehydrogenase family)
MTTINGRRAVVTGGASGIGRGIAEVLIEEGADVVIADIDEAALAATAHAIGAHAVPVDVTNAHSVHNLAERTEAVLGGVDIVVNNAGVGPLASLEDLTLADWRWILDVNLYGVIHGVHEFLPRLKANADGGHIVNTASMAAFSPAPELGAYAVSKYGVAALTEVLDLELKNANSDVKVTLLAPGTVSTNIKESLRHRPTVNGESGLRDVDISQGLAADVRWITPREAGRVLRDAILENELYAITHPEWWHMVDERQGAIRRAFHRGHMQEA